MQSRNTVIIIALSISFVFCLFTVVPLLAQESSGEAWIGLGIGGSLGVWGCLLLLRAIHRSKANNGRNSDNSNSTPDHTSSQWMIISAVGGMFLARLVSTIFDPGIQTLINHAVGAWIITSFSGTALLLWRYFSNDWELC
jgi:hypothetical protein